MSLLQTIALTIIGALIAVSILKNLVHGRVKRPALGIALNIGFWLVCALFGITAALGYDPTAFWFMSIGTLIVYYAGCFFGFYAFEL